MPLNFVVIVNDGGELETVTSTELDTWANDYRDERGRTSPLSEQMDEALNQILNARAIAAGEYDPSDNDTPIEIV